MISTELTALEDIEALGRAWRELEPLSDISFFVSWSWVGPWLQLANSNGKELYLYRCRKDDQTIALAVFSRSRIKRRKFFSYEVLALHEVPAPGLDMIIEYNSLLIRRGHEEEIHRRLVPDISKTSVRWDEIRLSGLSSEVWKQIASNACGLIPHIEEQRAPWVTDISGVNGDLDTLLAPLSRNRRWQIRRSFKAFQEEGELQVSTPDSLQEALTWFDQMGELHTARWSRVGEAGSFVNEQWVKFHKSVIQQGFERDEIQLLRITANDHPIGYIYSLVWRHTAYMLQSGFSQEEDNVKRPGYVSHCLAMQFNSSAQHQHYDFMCGDSEYKRVLAKEAPPLTWGAIQRKSVKWQLETLLTQTIRRLRQWRPNSR